MTTPRSINTCPTCGKKSYQTRTDAKQAARRTNPARHLTPYQCTTGYWHFGTLAPIIARGASTRDATREYPPQTTNWAQRNNKGTP